MKVGELTSLIRAVIFVLRIFWKQSVVFLPFLVQKYRKKSMYEFKFVQVLCMHILMSILYCCHKNLADIFIKKKADILGTEYML
jgi:hypothetical protein